MDYIGIGLYITEYGTHSATPHCLYIETVNDETTSRRLDYPTALKLMWELELAGATKTIRVHDTVPSINYREVHYWVRH